jgi:hypothetical protein
MRLEDSDSSLILEVRERLPAGVQGAGDTRFSVTVRAGGFEGRCEDVWIGAGELRQFAVDLERLHRERTGSAELASMSPEEFRLAILAVGNAGRIAAEGYLGSRHLGIRGWHRNRVELSIDLDPTTVLLLREQLVAS